MFVASSDIDLDPLALPPVREHRPKRESAPVVKKPKSEEDMTQCDTCGRAGDNKNLVR